MKKAFGERERHVSEIQAAVSERKLSKSANLPFVLNDEVRMQSGKTVSLNTLNATKYTFTGKEVISIHAINYDDVKFSATLPNHGYITFYLPKDSISDFISEVI